ncbi:EamA family transporter [Roseospira visakhapatnamensis]|uniref:Drug/metabolite transporter (DMT)-like permease n=1 Tax=Roseospira visakhapatnamensis TaxID=390880 RepID=A0A7W6REY8_9PROT|nr:drug/metabolite transporter (DMT)-like permease [Roseospira visakhapatnamensis]
MGLVFSLLWASAFVVGKVALQYTDPMTLLSARFLIAGITMVFASWVRGGTRPFTTPRLWRDGLVLGLLNNALYLGLSFWGLRTISPEATILIVSLAPFITSALAMLLGAPHTVLHFIGMGVGFLGVYVVLSARMLGGEDHVGMFFVLVATLAFSFGTLWYRRSATHHDAVTLNGVQNVIAGLMLAPFVQDFVGLVSAFESVPFVISFLHLVLGVSILDFLIWLALLRRIEAGQAASFHLLNPIFGIALSWLLIGSDIHLSDLAGAILVLAGLALIMRASRVNRPTRSGRWRLPLHRRNKTS